LFTRTGMQFASDLDKAMAALGYQWDGGSFFTACAPDGTHCGCSWQKVAPGGYYWVTWEITASGGDLSSGSTAQLTEYWIPGGRPIAPRSPGPTACGAA